MLPNHAPLVIAEQFGTLAELHPGRIDLGLGRAPGTDQETLTALRRDARSAETFPDDVIELQGYLGDTSHVPGVNAIPGRGTGVPLYILGSSLFGAHLAAALGLPYAFASHFAPAALVDAVRTYRERFQPSEQLERPYVIAGVNVLAADREDEARRQLERRRRVVTRAIFSRPGRPLDEAAVDELLRRPQGRHVDQMLAHTAAGTPAAVAAFLDDFRRYADADELMTVHGADTLEGRLRSLELLAGASELAAA
jgi:luciferase family oxidoreductase group 1